MFKKTIFPFLLSLLIILSLSTICFSQQSTIEYGIVTVQCPETVKIGTPLDVAVTFYNKTEISLTITKLLVALTGNVGNSISGIGFFGPYSRDVNWDIPGGQTVLQTVRIIDKVPASLAGKVSAASVMITSRDYKTTYGSDSCVVNVVK